MILRKLFGGRPEADEGDTAENSEKAQHPVGTAWTIWLNAPAASGQDFGLAFFKDSAAFTCDDKQMMQAQMGMIDEVSFLPDRAHVIYAHAGDTPENPHPVSKADAPTLHGFLDKGGFLVSEAVAQVLGAHDLGTGEMRPIDILGEDGEAPLGRYHWLVIRAKKNTLLPEAGAQPLRRIWEKPPRYGIPGIVGDDTFALGPAALDGPDIWQEQAVSRQLFMSDRLVSAIRDAGLEDLALHFLRVPVFGSDRNTQT